MLARDCSELSGTDPQLLDINSQPAAVFQAPRDEMVLEPDTLSITSCSSLFSSGPHSDFLINANHIPPLK